jgi:polyhydroxyalkanoate synthase
MTSPPKTSPQKDQPAKLPPSDPVAFGQQMHQILERLQPLMADYAEKAGHGGLEGLQPQMVMPSHLPSLLMNYWHSVIKRPQKVIDLQVEYWQNLALLWQEMGKKWIGEPSQDIAEPDKSDRRFRDPMWKENFAFDFIKQSYLLTSDWLQKMARGTEGMPYKDQAKLDFYTRQFVDALAPNNFAMTNPEVIRETLASGGQNLLRGLENLVEDLERGKGELEISKTNYTAFEIGKNIAVTPGKVVFENELMQLIQYTPTTKDVFKTPLLIVPPWINKYYILDMRPDNSFVRWAIAEGHTVFVISWVNPDRNLARKGFDAYMEEGLIAALDAIQKATGEKQANVIGYCIGGTLLATSLAYMATKGMQKRVASATFLTTLIDFSESGDLSVFIDEDQMKLLNEKMEEKGYLEGSELRNTFSLLRANDLIWSFVVNNYMMGKEPFPFDLLYWNDDSTNMPAAMHKFYLQNMYIKNLLKKPGGIKIEGVPIDVSKITVPAYFLSTKEDHIAPWKSTYEGMLLLGGKKTFALSASGHVAGVVNPPAAKKYHYWADAEIDDRNHPEDWLKRAKQTDGSWWTHWAKWVKETSGPKVPARQPGDGKLKALEDAPGRYVKMKAE